jgi:hypothetical protein
MPSNLDRFFSLPVSGNAKLLALRLSTEPFTDDLPKPRNTREFAASLAMLPHEYERAFLELRDIRVGLMTSPHLDRPQLPRECFVRELFDPKPVEDEKFTDPDEAPAPLFGKKARR